MDTEKIDTNQLVDVLTALQGTQRSSETQESTTEPGDEVVEEDEWSQWDTMGVLSVGVIGNETVQMTDLGDGTPAGGDTVQMLEVDEVVDEEDSVVGMDQEEDGSFSLLNEERLLLHQTDQHMETWVEPPTPTSPPPPLPLPPLPNTQQPLPDTQQPTPPPTTPAEQPTQPKHQTPERTPREVHYHYHYHYCCGGDNHGSHGPLHPNPNPNPNPNWGLGPGRPPDWDNYSNVRGAPQTMAMPMTMPVPMPTPMFMPEPVHNSHRMPDCNVKVNNAFQVRATVLRLNSRKSK